ncbi:unnamed protein product [Schistosoma turkestanicum]|nr:unnamed protein product [Schistosoma turkestanicum]
MLHRPTLMPPSMKSSTKFNLSTNLQHPSQSIKIESPEFDRNPDCDGDETNFVEPRNRDKISIKQEDTTFEDVLTKRQEYHTEEVDHNRNDTNMNSTESHIPVSITKVDEPTRNGTPITVSIDSAKTIDILPLNNAIQTLLTSTPHVPTIQNVSIQPILPGKVSGSGSVQNSSVVPSVLPTLWLHSPVVNPTAISVPNLNNLTDLTNNIVQNTTNALNPLVAAVLVNCATVNMISQLAGSMCSPIMNSLIDANVSVGNVNSNNSNNNNVIQSGISSRSSSGSGVTTVTIPTASILPNLLSAIPLSTHVPGLTVNTTNAGIFSSANNACDVGVNSAVVSSTGTLITNTSNNTGSMIVIPSKVENVPTTSLSSSVNFSQVGRNNVMYNTEISDVNVSLNKIVKNNENNNSSENNVAVAKTQLSGEHPDFRVLFTTKLVSESGRHYCPYPGCDSSYTRQYRLNQHISTHLGTGPIPCDAPNCNAKYFSQEDLKRHKLSRHSKVDKSPRHRHACTYSGCSKVFWKLDKLKEHLSTHTDERPYVCCKPGCGATFVQLSEVKSHELTHENVPRQLDNYPVTMVNDVIKTNLGTSIPASDIEVNSKITTTLPDILPKSAEPKETRNEKSIVPTIRRKRTLPVLAPKSTVSLPICPIIQYMCTYPLCGKVYSQFRNFKKHLKSHTGERLYVCRGLGCDASFSRLSGVRSHELSHLFPHKLSGSLEQFPTTISNDKIGTSFDSSDQRLNIQGNSEISTTLSSMLPKLTEPMEIINEISITPTIPLKLSIPTINMDSGLKLFNVCPFKECGKTFLRRSKLREHICRHTGVRPFVCDRCKASFVRRCELRRHTNIHLRGAQPRSLSRFLPTPQQQQPNQTLQSIVSSSQTYTSTGSVTTTTTNTTTVTTTSTNNNNIDVYTTPIVTSTASTTKDITNPTNSIISIVPVPSPIRTLITTKVEDQPAVPVKMEEITDKSIITKKPCDTTTTTDTTDNNTNNNNNQSSTHTLLYTLLQSSRETSQFP